MRLTKLAIATLWACSLSSHSYNLPPENLILANTYQQGIDVSEYWKSEKLDGIRALWDGNHLYTRNGNQIYAPTWFTEQLPKVRLEGELWAGRGKFHLVQSTVLDHTPSDTAWREIKFMLFDMPGAAGDYQKRYYNILHWVSLIDESHVGYIEHVPIKNEKALFHQLDNIDERNGEGLMLRKITSRYQAGRSNDLLKLKRHHDAEATVIGYKSGTGKYKGMMGSILVHTEEGVEFYIGSGFSDKMRLSPPEIGSRITFRYNGFTQNGKPKFARFVREKSEY
ncbi:MAG: DNA ligase [Vibrio toranzoniae]|uniref:DNA ligase n=1 Tax=Vibrio TaxID=662 RepID=UPI000989623D|nr:MULTISPECIES: DNA ligase [Vibrio]MDA0145431.1 DNA ligase [Vibrio sp. RW]NAZ47366.1 DNA ligase [Vibrio toranzoniae]NAZ54702.1 DNA ligase [Vibrio toranzoniae]NAZ69986.1 DNA ligase [Vibrio toranzoniae]QPK04286.1 DNA ligase [Vibrio kanaloae]